ncbi:MAG: signal peptidase I [Clostridia bacterium]|nr:signal peptidase I [Clostridia bacterium]
MNKKAKTVLRILLLALVGVIVGVNIYSLNAAHLTGDPLPMPFGVGVTVVLSGSMEPELSVGDLLIVAEEESYGVDDVIVFRDGYSAVVHRIVEVNGDEIVTRGDANNTNDEPITKKVIKGRVILAIPFLGHVVNFIKNPVVTVLLVAAVIFVTEYSFARRKKTDAQELEQIKAEIELLKKEQEQASGED